MEFDRVLGYEQLACDLGVGGAVDEEVENVHFARGQVVSKLDGSKHVVPGHLGLGHGREELDVVEHEQTRAEHEQDRRHRHECERIGSETDADIRTRRFSQPAEDDAEGTQVYQRQSLVRYHVGQIGHDAEPVHREEAGHEIAYEEHDGRNADLGLQQDIEHGRGHRDKAADRADPLVPVVDPGCCYKTQ